MGNEELFNDFFDPEISVVTPVLSDEGSIKTDEGNNDGLQNKKNEKTETVRQVGEDVEEITFSIDKPAEDNQDDTSVDDTTGDDTSGEKIDDKSKTPSDEGDGSSPIPHSLIAKALYEEGVFTSFDEKEFESLTEELGSPALALIELNKRTITDQIEAYKNSLSEEGKKFLDALEKGVPFEEYADVKKAQLNVNSVDEKELATNEELCKNLIESDLYSRGFSPEEIKEQIEDIEAIGKLEIKGKAALKSLKQLTEKQEKQLVAEAEERRKKHETAAREQEKKLRETVEAIKEMVPGTAVSDKLKKQMFDAITKPAAEAPNGQPVNAIWAKRMEDPMAFDIKLAYLLSTGIFDNNWSTLTKAAKTGAVKELETKLQTGTVTKTGQSQTFVSRKQEDILASLRKTLKPKTNN